MTKSADAFRTISEVADWLGIPAHVLRFWESKFTQVKPVKRAGGRRYYRPADMRLLGGIRKLLHEDGMTIKGVQKVLRDHGVRHVVAMSPPLEDELEEDIADIALDVPQEEEKLGRVLSFERTRSDTPPPPEGVLEVAKVGNPTKAEPPTPPGRASPAPPPGSGQPRVAVPKGDAVQAPTDAAKTGPPPKDAPDAVYADNATPERPAPAAPMPRAASIDVPLDAPDDLAAGASPLARLGMLNRSKLAKQLPALTDLTGRMDALRKRMTTGSEPS